MGSRSIRIGHRLLCGLIYLASACGGPTPQDTSDADISSYDATVDVDAGPTIDAGYMRTTSLGFTPFPYDVTIAAVDTTYQRLGSDGDLYAFHTTEGVPWVEAAVDATVAEYGSSIRSKWSRHQSEVNAHDGHKVYLGLTPLDDSRTRLADYWSVSEHGALPPPFDTATFDTPIVKAAYLSHCRRAIEHYNPDYLAIALEANILMNNNPAAWSALKVLLEETYAALKLDYPELPIFVTVTAVDLLEDWTSVNHQDQLQAMQDIMLFSDYLALSFYPYLSAYLTNPWPSDTFDLLAAFAPNKPMVLAETGYPAQQVVLPSFGLTFDGTPEKQRDWISFVLDQARTREMPFVVNFVHRDYDALWVTAGSDDWLAIWRDTGFVDEDGVERLALDTWREFLATARAP